jgi:hypothetical protein
MANYVLVYKDGAAAAEQADRDEAMEAWTAWFADLGDAVVDAGNPFGPSASVTADGDVSTGATTGLTGYSIVKADSLEEATDLAKDCPHLDSGGMIEVYETFEVM